MKNTFLSMLKQSIPDTETNERNEETNTMEIPKRNNIFSSNDDYSTNDLSFLNSSVFIGDGSNVLLAEPKDMEDAEVIAEAVINNRPVIIMLDELKDGMDQRILDFISGVCYIYGIAPRQLKKEKKFLVDPMNKRPAKFR